MSADVGVTSSQYAASAASVRGDSGETLMSAPAEGAERLVPRVSIRAPGIPCGSLDSNVRLKVAPLSAVNSSVTPVKEKAVLLWNDRAALSAPESVSAIIWYSPVGVPSSVLKMTSALKNVAQLTATTTAAQLFFIVERCSGEGRSFLSLPLNRAGRLIG